MQSHAPGSVESYGCLSPPQDLCEGGRLTVMGGSVGRVLGQLWWAQGLTKHSTFHVLKTGKLKVKCKEEN